MSLMKGKIAIFNHKGKRFVDIDNLVSEIEVPEGTKGDKGDKGDQGEKGEQGLQGVQGVKGDKGDQGEQGVAGEKGSQGTQGVQGVQGIKGDTGNGFSLAKTYPSVDTMNADFSNPDIEIHSFVLIDSDDLDNGKLYVKNETEYSFQSQLSGVKGDKGDTGVQGVQGVAGAQGARGIQGLQGLQGVQGERGIQGIQGIKGDTGAKGDKGDRGEGSLPTLNGIYQMPISTKSFYVELPSQTGVNKVRLIVSGNSQNTQSRIGFGGSSTSQSISLVYGYYLTASYTDLNKIKTGRANNSAITTTVLYPTDTTVLVGYGDIFDAVVTNQTTLESWTVRISGVVAKPDAASTAGRLHVFIQKVFDNATQTVQTGTVY